MCCVGWQVREVYERAIANVPPAPEKRYWQRYIYLWVKYALWEELEAGGRRAHAGGLPRLPRPAAALQLHLRQGVR